MFVHAIRYVPSQSCTCRDNQGSTLKVPGNIAVQTLNQTRWTVQKGHLSTYDIKRYLQGCSIALAHSFGPGCPNWRRSILTSYSWSKTVYISPRMCTGNLQHLGVFIVFLRQVSGIPHHFYKPPVSCRNISTVRSIDMAFETSTLKYRFRSQLAIIIMIVQRRITMILTISCVWHAFTQSCGVRYGRGCCLPTLLAAAVVNGVMCSLAADCRRKLLDNPNIITWWEYINQTSTHIYIYILHT